MVEHETVGSQQLVTLGEERAEIARSDVLHHPDRGDAVELAGHVSVIGLLDADRKVSGVLTGHGDLFDRRADAGDVSVVAL